jgi:S1-C subfamily serine protease
MFLALVLALIADPISGCVWVRAENDGAGAGFVVDAKRKWILTCRHVVGDRDRADVFFAWHRDGKLVTDKSQYLGNRNLLRERGLLVTGKVLKKSDDADLAILELDSLPDTARELKLASAPVRLGDPLRVIGHRLDLDTLFNFTTGPVRQTGPLANGYFWRGKKLAAGADAILGQLPIEEGDSGGPVLDARGEVVGMASALRRQVPTAAVAISAMEIRRLVIVPEGAGSVSDGRPAPSLTLPARAPNIGDALMRATVWVRPGSTEFRTAGVLVSNEYIVTSNRGIGSSNWVGVAFPIRRGEKWTAEADAYRDPIDVLNKGAWETAEVVARDPDRDLALIRILGVPPAWMKPLKLAPTESAVGDAVHSMSHPGGVEFAWVYASGAIRQRGRVALAEGGKAVKVESNLLQLPTQAASPGGPVVNAAGELVGIVAARESTQQTGYSASWAELEHFLNVHRTDVPARSVEALAARITGRWNEFAPTVAFALSEASRGRDERFIRLSLKVGPISLAVLDLCSLLDKAGRSAEADAELDRLVALHLGDPMLHFLRAERRIVAKNWRGALGDLQQVVAVRPWEGGAHRLRIRVLLELKKDDEAAAAVGDAVRVETAGLAAFAKELLEQADEKAKTFPDTPSIPANWLRLAIGAAAKFDPSEARRKECEVVLKEAAAAPDDAARLRILRDFLQKR